VAFVFDVDGDVMVRVGRVSSVATIDWVERAELLALLIATPNPELRRAIVQAYKKLIPEDDAMKSIFAAEEQSRTSYGPRRRQR